MSAVATVVTSNLTQRYAKCIAASKRIRWDIDQDVIRGREFEFGLRARKQPARHLETRNDAAVLASAGGPWR